jgi:Na+/H+ antiporter NhaD/arsenite permease-like protein
MNQPSDAAHLASVPGWTMLPFGILVLSMAALPIVVPKAWEHRWFQALVVALCTCPILVYLAVNGQGHAIGEATAEYASFITTIGALFIAAGGVYVSADLEATPSTNVAFLVVGSILASAIGTTGASMLLIRPLLRTNSQREHRSHLVPFFILAVANAGGLLTPLGDPPLLVGFIGGVPFFWTLKLFPIWLLYVAVFACALFVVDRRAYAKESAASLQRDRAEVKPFELLGVRNVVLIGLVIIAAFLPYPMRELGMVAVATASYFGTPKEVHKANEFSLAPIIEVGLLFIGLFGCLIPIEIGLESLAPSLPLQKSWQLFWVTGALSGVLDNAPTYAAFAALARGLSVGHADLVSGIEPLKLAAISAGSVIMGATTYIGNGPNLMVKAVAERFQFSVPSFARYALFAFLVMLPAHLVMTLAFLLLER